MKAVKHIVHGIDNIQIKSSARWTETFNHLKTLGKRQSNNSDR